MGNGRLSRRPSDGRRNAQVTGVVLALVFEPIPGALIRLIGVTLIALISRRVLYNPGDLAAPGFNPTTPPDGLVNAANEVLF